VKMFYLLLFQTLLKISLSEFDVVALENLLGVTTWSWSFSQFLCGGIMELEFKSCTFGNQDPLLCLECEVQVTKLFLCPVCQLMFFCSSECFVSYFAASPEREEECVMIHRLKSLPDRPYETHLIRASPGMYMRNMARFCSFDQLTMKTTVSWILWKLAKKQKGGVIFEELFKIWHYSDSNLCSTFVFFALLHLNRDEECFEHLGCFLPIDNSRGRFDCPCFDILLISDHASVILLLVLLVLKTRVSRDLVCNLIKISILNSVSDKYRVCSLVMAEIQEFLTGFRCCLCVVEEQCLFVYKILLFINHHF